VPDPGDAAALALEDPEYHAAVVDLLGLLAYGELSAFERLAADAALAPDIPAKAALAEMAVAEFHHFQRLTGRLSEMGADPQAAMRPFRDPLDAFHRSTAPSTWLEGLVKAYVGDGIGQDFYTEVAAFLDPQTRALVTEVMADLGHSAFAVQKVRAAIEDDPRVAGRLALWGRRLVGEALSQAQRVAAERDSFDTLFVGTVARPGIGLGGVGAMFSRIIERHAQRMSSLGLAS
jgi:hypothetical protein